MVHDEFANLSWLSTLAQSGEAIAPRWAVVLVASLALLVIVVHVISLMHADTHPSRRRIRIANGLLMMGGVVSLAYAVGGVTPDKPREFTFAWTLVLSLMAMIVGVACLDALNSVRLHAAQRRAVRRELDKARLEVAVRTGRLGPRGPGSSPPPSGPPANTPA